jgi:cytochrome P450
MSQTKDISIDDDEQNKVRKNSLTNNNEELSAEQIQLQKLKHEQYRLLRLKQFAEANRRFNKFDFAIGLTSWLILKRIFKYYGLSMKKFLFNFCGGLLLWFLYKGKAPQKILPINAGDFPIFPIVGQVLQIRNVISKGLVGNQIERSVMRNFQTAEVVLFGPIRDFGIMDVKDREYILRSNWRNFTKNLPGSVGFQEFLAPVMGRGIFAVDGEEWAEHRKVSSHLFAANALRNKMETSFAKHAEQLVELLSKHRLDQEIDLQDIFQAFTFDTICDIAFGADPQALEAAIVKQEKIDFLIRFDRAQNLCFNRLVVPVFVWKALRYFDLSYEKQLSEDTKELRTYVQKIIEERKRTLSMSEADKYKDILSMYMRTARESNKPYLEEDEYLQDVVLNIAVAGRDTTSSTLINLFRVLSQRPDVASKMLTEMNQVLKGARHVSWDHIPDLLYSGASFNEILRLYPPVPGDFRLCNETCTLPSGLVIPKGSRVSMPVAAIGRDTNLWPDAHEFKPERWLDSDDPARSAIRIPEYVLPSFWGGPRKCLGKDAARLEVLSTAYLVLSSGLKFRLLPGQNEQIKIGPVQFYEEGVFAKVEKV